MIINNTWNFIFVHIPKCGGTTVSESLKKYTKYCDLELGGTWFGEKIQSFYAYRFGLKKHSRAEQIKSVVGDNIWRSYYKFSFVRDPFSRATSTYHFLLNWYDEDHKDFYDELRACKDVNEFIASGILERFPGHDDMFRPQVRWLTDGAAQESNFIVDFIGRVETLGQDLQRIVSLLGLPDEAPESILPRANVSPQGGNVRRLNAESVAIIQRLYADDFRLLQYKTTLP